MGSIFEIGEYKLDSKNNNIYILKKTPNYIHLHIKEYHGRLYSIYDANIRKKIFIDENNNEYIKNIYYSRWSIFTPSKRVLDSEDGFDCLKINSYDLEKITE